jgi:DNA repair photolyase
MSDSSMSLRTRKGRGALTNRSGRYEDLARELIDDGWGSGDEPLAPLRTIVSVDDSSSIIARNQSPDVPFEQSINPYRGCEHGCVYCFARPTHAYLGLSPGLDFESRLFAKPDAARLLQQELQAPGYRCKVFGLGTNTDPYQPIERKWRVTRQILEVLATHRHPLTIVTKSALVERDIDILSAMARERLVRVTLSLTTFDRQLARRMEPRATAPQRRLQTLHTLSQAGIPTAVLVAPLIPGLNDSEMETIVRAGAVAGVQSAGYVLVRLPLEIKALFKEWLSQHYPLRKNRVMSLIRQARQGRENDARFGTRMTGTGAYADLIARRFDVVCKQLGLNQTAETLDTTRFRVTHGAAVQPDLFER